MEAAPGGPSPAGAVSHRVLVLGEALTDIVQRPSGVTEHPGGSPMNVAYGLARLGVPTTLLTSLGPDERGDAIEAHLRAVGVHLAAGSRAAARTATATALIDSTGAASYRFDIDWVLPEAPSLDAFSLVHSGSIASFLQPGADAVRRVLHDARDGRWVSYDPNIRAALVGERRSGVTAFEDTAALAHVVKLSDEDAQWLYPETNLDRVLRRILELGPVLAVATAGAHGSILCTADQVVRVPAAPVDVADTIGAGDSFMSALLEGLVARTPADLSELDLAALGHRASAAAAITVSRPGADPPSRSELDLATP